MLKSFFSFLLDIYRSRFTLLSLAKNDFKSRYLTTLLGALWAFVQPLVTILVFWFVFDVGFRSAPVNDVPFVAWFVPSFLIWSYFTECLGATTNSLREYSYLVKKVQFRVSLIPLVKVISSSFVHLAFIGVILVIVVAYNVGLSIYNIQVLYYFLCTVVLLIGLGWLLSSIGAFTGDIANIVNVVIQIGFWATPIFWNPETMSPTVVKILKLNPMFYICQGYRDSFIDHVWFWERGLTLNIYFWLFTSTVFILGALVFKRLRSHFADVL